jgi:hypothetical protein
MSRTGEIQLWFGGEQHTFRLGIKELRKLQEKCADRTLGERSPFRILRDLHDGDGKVDDILQPILLGLVGGGMKPEDAARLVKERVEDRPLHENTVMAALILNAAISGPPDDLIAAPAGDTAPGEPAGAETGSASPSSTRTEPSSGGPPDRSMN